MDRIIKQYLPRISFRDYADFKENYRVNVPDSFNFGFDVVDFWAREEPDKLALVWCDDHGEEKRFTFSDISALSAQAANYFLSLGVRKGMVVMLILRRRWEYWICATALHKIGAILIPGTLQLAKKDLVFRGQRAGIHAIICVNDPYVIEQVEAAAPEIPSLQHKLLVGGAQRTGWHSLNQEMSAFPQRFERPTGEEATKSSDIMVIYFTSGTTGMPKTVAHNFAHPLGHIVTAKYWLGVQENKLHMSVSDSGWAKFGWGKIYGQWLCGTVVFAYDMDKFIPANLLQKMQDYHLTTFCAPPTMYRFMLQEDVSKYDLSSIERFCTAGEPLNPEVSVRWEQMTGKKINEGFGQTEGTVLIGTFIWDEPHPNRIGRPSPIYDIKLLKEDNTFAADNEEGAIIVDHIDEHYPVGLFVRYYHDEEQTKEVLGGRWYNLHDLAIRDSEGFYCFVGRNDDVIKCSGYRIGPFEVESAVLEHHACVECAITAAPDPIRGQVVKATIVLAKGYTPSEALKKEIQDHVKHVTAPYKYPRIIEFVDELPKTLGGKIKRAMIREENYAEESGKKADH